MKRCPKCSQFFDDHFDYCLEDGSRLVVDASVGSTMPTIAMSARDTAPDPMPYKVVSPILYLIVGVLATGFIAALLFIFWMPRQERDTVANGPNAQISGSTTPQVRRPVAGPTETEGSSVPISPPVTPDGTWSGNWLHDRGTSSFTATVELEEDGGRLEGRIVWTLVRSSRPEKADKSGMTAVEYVRGTFDQETRMIKLKGYRKDDPNNLVIYDTYDLSLAADQRSMSGRSKNGTFDLKR